jgi:hypothetical protein
VALAEAYRLEGNEERAVLEFRAARSTFEKVGAMQLAERAAAACGVGPQEDESRPRLAEPPPLRAEAGTGSDDGAQPNVFRREGDYWRVTFDGHTARLRDTKGLRYLTRLLAEPGLAVHVLELVASEHGQTMREARDEGWSESVVPVGGDAGELLDARAKDAYRRRLAEIDEDMEDARAVGDSEREAQADAERVFLARELSRAVGLGGRDRRAGSAAERARASVTQAVRAALRRIHEHHPALGRHLDRTIRTGAYCTYLPARERSPAGRCKPGWTQRASGAVVAFPGHADGLVPR